MRPKVALGLLMLSIPALAGCLGGTGGASNGSDAALGVDGTADAAGLEMATNGTASGFLELADPWEGQDHLLLMDATIRRDDGGCWAAEPVAGRGRCATWSLPPGAVVPMGTRTLYVEADLARMGDHTYRVEIAGTAGRDDDLEGQDIPGPIANWSFDLEPIDWDLPGAESSGIDEVYLQVAGADASVGPDFDVRIGVIRDPDWTPTPILDPWQDPANHTYTPEGSMVLAWENTTFQWTGYAVPDLFGLQDGYDQPEYRFGDRVPFGATALTIGVRLDSVSNCEAVAICLPEYDVRAGARDHYWTDDIQRGDIGPNHVIRTYSVPDEIAPDPEGPQEGRVYLEMVLLGCDVITYGQGDRGYCGYEGFDNTFGTGILVEAWQGDPDLDAFKQRLGVV